MTNFWLNDINILMNRRYLTEIIPNNNYDVNRNLNVIVRSSIYGSLILYFIYKNTNVFLLPLISSIITIIMYKNNIKIQEDEYIKNTRDKNIENKYMDHVLKNIKDKYREPTINNPFMNLNLLDQDNKVALESTNNIVSDEIYKNSKFNKYTNPYYENFR